MYAIALLGLSVLLIYLFVKRQFSYWKSRNVPGPEPSFLLGNIGEYLMGKKHLVTIVGEIYNKYEGYPFVGIFRASVPCLIVKDPELVKNIMIKDFKHFAVNDFDVDKEKDPLFGRNPFVTTGEYWKSKRAEFTPVFTSGKMKALMPLIEEVCKRMVKYIGNTPEAFNGTGLEAKELCTKYTVDNVAISAFGIEAKCFDEPNSEFRVLAEKFISPGFWNNLTFLLMMLFPTLSKILPVKFVSREVERKLMDIVTTTMKYREENNVERNDFLQHIIHLMKKNKDMTDLDATGNASTFFADGYETSSIVMSFFLYDLSQNPEVQRKAREEIERVIKEKHEGKFTYEALQDMSYFDACFYESVRKNSAVGMLLKRCSAKYEYKSTTPGFKNLSITIEPGTKIILPARAIQLDPNNFPEPEVFKPERFLDKDVKHVFFPFGDGPRICLGRSFGILQIKLGVANILRNYEVTLNKRTKLPLKMDPWYFLNSPIGGLWLDFKKINK